MQLVNYRVEQFKTVDDSGWIEVGDINGFIGINESGKSNLLTPLWKLNPTDKITGAIDLLSDLPRRHYAQLKNQCDDITFIEGSFLLTDEDVNVIQENSGLALPQGSSVRISRNYAGKLVVTFLEGDSDTTFMQENYYFDAHEICSGLESAINEENEGELKPVIAKLNGKGPMPQHEITQLLESVPSLPDQYSEDSYFAEKVDKARNEVTKLMPCFVYYSNYGVLDSEIYLPHVINNMERADLSSKEKAKAHTLKVLFDYLDLDPKEILQLGQENANPNDGIIEQEAVKKNERAVLLQSAATELSRGFNDWYRQGEYTFSFEADGSYFRIRVSDAVRKEPVELEKRSTGLQWFFSFYLVFLAEGQGKHKDAVLLLDEPGQTLHAMAQRDLSVFFENLAESNQIIFTAHSPFIIDPEHLERIKAVYFTKDGLTVITNDLRAAGRETGKGDAVYAAHAALGLSTSDVLLSGCTPVIVEGISDQYYLSIIKDYLILKGLIKPQKEMLFMPCGGVKGIKSALPLITGGADSLPVVLVDSDEMGNNLKASLTKKDGLYANNKEKVISVGEFVEDIEGSEIEDILDTDWLSGKVISKVLRGPEDDFEDVFERGTPVVNQVEKWANNNEYSLPDGWKVDIAKEARKRFSKNTPNFPKDVEKGWAALFGAIIDRVG